MTRPAIPSTTSLRTKLVTGWALLGVCALVGQAILRLAPRAAEALVDERTTSFQLGVTVAWVCSNAYLEGYRGFQKRFVPRVVARAAYLESHPTWLRQLFAPGFVMGYFDARPRVLATAWGLTALIVLAVTIVSRIAQPYRGMIDAGVVVGLVWGLAALLVGVVNWKTGGKTPLANAEVPGAEARDAVLDASTDDPPPLDWKASSSS